MNGQLLVRLRCKFPHRYVTLCEFFSEFSLTGEEHKEGISLGLVSSCPSYSVDVGVRVLGAINLDDPIDGGEIDTTGRDIRTEKHGVLFLNKLEVDGRSFVLVLLSVQFKQVLGYFEGLECLVSETYLLP